MKVSFWFAPVVMSVGAILLAWLMYWLDGFIPNQLLETSRLVLAGTPADMRAGLISMAGTILATAGVVFTLLTLPLSTVAAQYGSRLLRVFLGDRVTQLVLGMFVATFVYCMAAALSIPPPTVEPESPQLTATLGLYLMLATFASLIVLVQHISIMLQAPNIAAAAGAELREVVLAEIPDEGGSGDDPNGGGETLPGSLVETTGYPVRIREYGYIQYVDPESLLALARDKDLVIRLLRKPGHFIRHDRAVALVWPAGRVDDELDQQIRQAFQTGNARTPTQDVAYAVNQLVEMAVRAMSPAINDPFTAMTCLDHIGEGLALFIRQGEKKSHVYDQDGKLRLIFEPVTSEELFSAAFEMLRHCSCDNASVLQHMLHVIDSVSQEAGAPEVRKMLARQVSLIQGEVQAGRLIEDDRQRIQQSSETLVMKLSGAASGK
jgi:uncharacterized membrane protein